MSSAELFLEVNSLFRYGDGPTQCDTEFRAGVAARVGKKSHWAHAATAGTSLDSLLFALDAADAKLNARRPPTQNSRLLDALSNLTLPQHCSEAPARQELTNAISEAHDWLENSGLKRDIKLRLSGFFEHQSVRIASDHRSIWAAEDERLRYGVTADLCCVTDDNTFRWFERNIAGSRVFSTERLRNFADELKGCANLLHKARSAATVAPGDRMIIFSAASSGVLFHEIVGHLVEEGTLSGLRPPLQFGTRIGPEFLTVWDDPSIDAGFGSQLCDDAGHPAIRRPLIKDGTFVGAIMQDWPSAISESQSSARRQDYRHLPLARMTNLVVEAGDSGLQQVIHSAQSALLVTKLAEGYLDSTSLECSFVALEAYKIERGQVTDLVQPFVLAGTAPVILSQLIALCDDVTPAGTFCESRGSTVPVGTASPSCAVAAMTILPLSKSAVNDLIRRRCGDSFHR